MKHFKALFLVFVITIIGLVSLVYYNDSKTSDSNSVSVDVIKGNETINSFEDVKDTDMVDPMDAFFPESSRRKINRDSLSKVFEDYLDTIKIENVGNTINVRDAHNRIIDSYHYHKNLGGSYEICRVNHNVHNTKTYDELQYDVSHLENKVRELEDRLSKYE